MTSLHIDQDLLAEIAHRLDLREPNAASIESVAYAVSQHYDVEGKGAPFECVVDSATGVGKTYVMAGLIEYLSGLDTPARNFLLLVPGRTILSKSIRNFTPGKPKSLTAVMKSQPLVITAGDFASPATHAAMANTAKTKLFIFTVQALTSKTGDGRATHEFQETLGGSLYHWLAGLDDLVVLADESHLYRSPAFTRTINELKPEVVVGLTATPLPKERPLVVYRYPLSHAIRDQLVKTPVIVGRNDDKKDDYTQLLDGVTLLRYKEQVLDRYTDENGLEPVHPVMLVIAGDTAEADDFSKIIDSAAFDGGAWAGKILTVHSNLSGDDKEKALAALDAVEDPKSPVRIIISVGMLKEGWDVKSVYVIASMRASISDVLTEQTLGRGMRLPFGKYTGIQMLDTVEVLAHARYEELLQKREALNEGLIDFETWVQARELDSATTAAETVTRTVTDPVFTTATTVSEKTGGEVPSSVQSIEEVTAAAKAEAANATITPHEHLPIHARDPIDLPYIAHIEHTTPVSLNQIGDRSPFKNLGKGLAVDAAEELKRTILKAKGDKMIGVRAEDHVAAAKLDTPLERSRAELVGAVLSAPGVPQRVAESNAAEGIVEVIVAAMGADAAVHLSAYLETAKSRVRALVTSLLTSVPMGGITYNDEVRLEPLSKARRCARPHEVSPTETYVRATAYDGWKKNLYEFAWFDSSTEFAAAKAIDKGAAVTVWARLHKGDIPITWTESGREYNPDFVVVENGTDGKPVHWLVETKMDKEVTGEEVTAKRKAAVTWSNTVSNSGKVDGSWRYLLLSETDMNHAHGNWEQMKVLHS